MQETHPRDGFLAISKTKREFDTVSGYHGKEEKNKGLWGPFLERRGNLTGPKSYFEIKVSRKLGYEQEP